MHPSRSASPSSARPPFLRTRALTLLALAAIPACGSRPRPAPDLTNPGAFAAAQAAMLPTRLNIHPLTHIGLDPSGRPVLLLYVEFRDQFDQNTRALGNLRVTVHPSGLDPISGAADPATGIDGSSGAISWDIDLRDPDRNALLYDDLVTRTYALTLTGLPAWLSDWSSRRGNVAGTGVAGGAGGGGGGGGASDGAMGSGGGSGTGSPMVTVTFGFPDPRNPAGSGSSIRDSRRLGR